MRNSVKKYMAHLMTIITTAVFMIQPAFAAAVNPATGDDSGPVKTFMVIAAVVAAILIVAVVVSSAKKNKK
ncbi:MAG: hypothetical protein IKV41_02350 [Oscillospiraceae bacterium]|nr:hypothetical protein [Oscillospiraceae bacterium]